MGGVGVDEGQGRGVVDEGGLGDCFAEPGGGEDAVAQEGTDGGDAFVAGDGEVEEGFGGVLGVAGDGGVGGCGLGQGIVEARVGIAAGVVVEVGGLCVQEGVDRVVAVPEDQALEGVGAGGELQQARTIGSLGGCGGRSRDPDGDGVISHRNRTGIRRPIGPLRCLAEGRCQRSHLRISFLILPSILL